PGPGNVPPFPLQARAPGPSAAPPAPAPPAQRTGAAPKADPGIVQAQFVTPAPGDARTGPRLFAPVPAGDSPLRQYSVLPRTALGYQFESKPLPTGEQVGIFTG